jgi:16S rRNA (cytosine1402-N4)-methyltransferase
MHVAVLRQEIINFLAPKPGENFIDGTCGSAGHTLAILEKNQPGGKILCFDWDNDALARARKITEAKNKKLLERVIFINDNYANITRVVRKNNFGPVTGILLDLGMSSEQLAESGRGFSFLKDEPLDMRYSLKQKLTAREIINQWDQRALEEIFQKYGEERRAREISRIIIKNRKLKPILTTRELIDTIALVIPKKFQYARIHFATRIFQALRIAVNDELENLQRFLPQAINILTKEGRLVIVSFHSLEDRIVKRFFQQQAKEEKIQILTKKPVVPTFDEIKINPRSRSAKLRAALKI